MMKSIVLGCVAMLSFPALAQITPGRTPITGTPTDSTAQTPPPANTQTPPVVPGAATPATGAVPAAPAAPATGAAPAAQSVTGASQVAQIVDREFSAYDADSNGELSKAEFGAWMIKLKTAADPNTKAGDPATQTYVTGALTTADADKSGTVSRVELTRFLSGGAS